MACGGTTPAPVEVGHRSASVCHLANLARELGRPLRWDPQSETFPGDDEANALLDRPRRDGWKLPRTCSINKVSRTRVPLEITTPGIRSTHVKSPWL